jgi:hypothetical protein
MLHPRRIRLDFQLPTCVIAAKSISSSARSCAAPTLVECPLTSAANLEQRYVAEM